MQFATAVFGAIFAGILVSGLPNSERNIEEILQRIEKDPRISLIGDFTDPNTRVHKRYYIDSNKISWNAAYEWCEMLGFESVKIETVEELQFLRIRPALNETYYWTSGVQLHDYMWTLRGGSPINTTALGFCTAPAAPICLSLHKGSSGALHGQTCTSLLPPLCQLQT